MFRLWYQLLKTQGTVVILKSLGCTQAARVAAFPNKTHENTAVGDCWYFLRSLRNKPGARPWLALEEDGRRVVSFPATTSDHFWQCMDTTDTSEEYISRVADEVITSDGTGGEMIRVIETGGWPILITHWQSLFSNGLGTGLRALSEVARRIENTLSSRVRWMSAEEIMKLVLSEQNASHF